MRTLDVVSIVLVAAPIAWLAFEAGVAFGASAIREGRLGWLFKRSDIYFNNSLYMRRWLVGPMRGPGIRLHHIVRSDADRELHDHPFSFVSIILRGGYFEHTADGRCKWYGPGSVVVRSAEVFHRLRLKAASFDSADQEEQTTWTLVIRGPYRRQWGFLTENGWTPWQTFVAEKLKDVPTPRAPRPYEAPSSL